MQDYHTAQYGGIVTPEDIKRREEEERKRLEKLERQKNERRCPRCDMKAFPEDSVKLGDLYYHKACLTCSECNRTPDDNTPMMLGEPEYFLKYKSKKKKLILCVRIFPSKLEILSLNFYCIFQDRKMLTMYLETRNSFLFVNFVSPKSLKSLH